MIRDYCPADEPGLRRCVEALQEHERTLDPRLRPALAIVEAYLSRIHERCRANRGQVFVVEHDGALAGFAAVVAREPYVELDDPPGTYALVTDLIVLPEFRYSGYGHRLLAHAERFAREQGATELRVSVLAANAAARALYAAAGFSPYLEVLEKTL